MDIQIDNYFSFFCMLCVPACFGIAIAIIAQKLIDVVFAPVQKLVNPIKNLGMKVSNRFHGFISSVTGISLEKSFGTWTLMVFMLATTIYTVIRILTIVGRGEGIPFLTSVVENSSLGVAVQFFDNWKSTISTDVVLNVVVFSLVTNAFIKLSEGCNPLVRILYGIAFFFFSILIGDVVSEEIVQLFSGDWIASLNVQIPKSLELKGTREDIEQIKEWIVVPFITLLHWFLKGVSICIGVLFTVSMFSGVVITACSALLTLAIYAIAVSIVQEIMIIPDVVMGVVMIATFVLLEMVLLGVVEPKSSTEQCELLDEYSVDYLANEIVSFIAGYFGAPYMWIGTGLTIVGIIIFKNSIPLNETFLYAIIMIIIPMFVLCVLPFLIACIPGIVYILIRGGGIKGALSFVVKSIIYIPKTIVRILKYIVKLLESISTKFVA